MHTETPRQKTIVYHTRYNQAKKKQGPVYGKKIKYLRHPIQNMVFVFLRKCQYTAHHHIRMHKQQPVRSRSKSEYLDITKKPDR